MCSISAVREMLCCSHTMTNSFSDSRSNRIFSSGFAISLFRGVGFHAGIGALAARPRRLSAQTRVKRGSVMSSVTFVKTTRTGRPARSSRPSSDQIGDEQRPLLQANEANPIGKLRLEAVPVGAVEVDPGFQNALAARRQPILIGAQASRTDRRFRHMLMAARLAGLQGKDRLTRKRPELLVQRRYRGQRLAVAGKIALAIRRRT